MTITAKMSLAKLVGKVRGKKRLSQGEGEGEGEEECEYRAPVCVHILSHMLDSDTLFKSLNRIYLKGFYCMFVVKSVTDNTVVWRFLRNEDPTERLDTFDPRLDKMNLQSMKDVALGSIESMRHVLEWSGNDFMIYGAQPTCCIDSQPSGAVERTTSGDEGKDEGKDEEKDEETESCKVTGPSEYPSKDPNVS